MNKGASIFLLCSITAVCQLRAEEPDVSKLPAASDKTGLTYEKDIKPIFSSASCLRCHGNDRPKGGLSLTTLSTVMKGGKDGPVVVAGKSTQSPLVIAVAQIDDESAMPPKRRPGGPGGGFGPGNMLASQLMAQGDKDDDKKLSREEFTALADTWFDKLDPEKSGKVSRAKFLERIAELLPPPKADGAAPDDAGHPPRQPGRMPPPRMIGPSLFTAVDANKDGSLTRAELQAAFSKWFAQADQDKSGSISEKQLSVVLNTALPRPDFGGPGGPNGGADRGGPGGPSGARPSRGGPGGPGGGQGGPGGPPPKPLTAEQVGLVRAWVDQGAK